MPRCTSGPFPTFSRSWRARWEWYVKTLLELREVGPGTVARGDEGACCVNVDWGTLTLWLLSSVSVPISVGLPKFRLVMLTLMTEVTTARGVRRLVSVE
jgi:hypothetical protein